MTASWAREYRTSTARRARAPYKVGRVPKRTPPTWASRHWLEKNKSIETATDEDPTTVAALRISSPGHCDHGMVLCRGRGCLEIGNWKFYAGKKRLPAQDGMSMPKSSDLEPGPLSRDPSAPGAHPYVTHLLCRSNFPATHACAGWLDWLLAGYGSPAHLNAGYCRLDRVTCVLGEGNPMRYEVYFSSSYKALSLVNSPSERLLANERRLGIVLPRQNIHIVVLNSLESTSFPSTRPVPRGQGCRDEAPHPPPASEHHGPQIVSQHLG